MKTIRLNKRKSFRENGRKILPRVLEEFLTHSGNVIDRPRRIEELHQLRLTGKTLRYAMELFQTSFGRNFKRSLADLEKVISIMGTIHDSDVFIAGLDAFEKEIRIYNRSDEQAGKRFSVDILRIARRDHRTQREKLFRDLSVILRKWKEKDYRRTVIAAMKINQ